MDLLDELLSYTPGGSRKPDEGKPAVNDTLELKQV